MDEKQLELAKLDFENLVYCGVITRESAEELLEILRKKYFNS